MWIAILSCAALFIVPAIFVWNEVYDDGVIGRVALIGISISALIVGLNIFRRGWVFPETALLLFCAAVFLVWHLVRFHRRVLNNNRGRRHEIERRRGETIC